MKARQLLVSADSVKVKKQHTSPCSDCPWTRKSLKGWLGGTSLGRWLFCAHHDGRIECHTRISKDGGSFQCAGAAIYRANVAKSVEEPNLRMPANKIAVFAQPLEFALHHSNGKIKTHDQVRDIMVEQMIAASEAARAPKPGYTFCDRCGAQYKIGMPHFAFCGDNLEEIDESADDEDDEGGDLAMAKKRGTGLPRPHGGATGKGAVTSAGDGQLPRGIGPTSRKKKIPGRAVKTP